ncbi:lysophospholipid acyltransferase family protein [Cumulibacter soli]|uniref:lysophospholipid acyltransferase family protein n=1 Tax=Cumulibacter soli TaxID=2546344 RepID=UPI0010672F56|nr:lysophospholipid acyltransferase family protein [Cumulibacter soli]
MSRFESCPHLCARSGVTCRHEVSRWRVAMRLLALFRVAIAGAFGIALRRATDVITRRGRTPAYVAEVYRKLLNSAGIQVRITGVRRDFADGGEAVLVVANHVSWLDVMAYAWVQPVTMVSKKEIGDWPVIGAVARAAGTIFIDRHNPRAVARTERLVASRLRAGGIVATFPEATTTCGRGLGRMFPAMFQAAVDADVPVQPVAFTWLDRHGAITTAGAYVGDQPLLESIRMIVSQRDLVLQIDILPRIMPKHVRPMNDRKALRTAAAERIALALDPSVGDWNAHLRPATCVAGVLPIPLVDDPLVELDVIAGLPRDAVRRPRAAGAA